MIHLHPSQYGSYQELRLAFQKELIKNTPFSDIVDRYLLSAQERGFSKDDVWQIIDICKDECQVH
jgi:hypothetical protein